MLSWYEYSMEAIHLILNITYSYNEIIGCFFAFKKWLRFHIHTMKQALKSVLVMFKWYQKNICNETKKNPCHCANWVNYIFNKFAFIRIWIEQCRERKKSSEHATSIKIAITLAGNYYNTQFFSFAFLFNQLFETEHISIIFFGHIYVWISKIASNYRKKTNETEPIIVGDDVAILLFLTSVKYCVQTQHMISIEAYVSE